MYDKKKDGGLLYAFLDLQKCREPEYEVPHLVHTSESYNPLESNYQLYKNTVVNVGITGVSRQNSTQVQSFGHSGSLNDEDYKRIMELKNQRMKGMFNHH